MVEDDAAAAAAKEAGLPWIRGGLVEHSGGGTPMMEARHSPWGKLHAEVMRQSNFREHMWAFIMQGEDLPYETNAVDLSPSIRDARGLPGGPGHLPARGATSWPRPSTTATSSSRSSRRWGPST